MKNNLILATALSAFILGACGVNNKDVNDTALNNPGAGVTEPTRVNNPVNNQNNTGNNVNNVNNNTQNNSSKMRVPDRVADKIVSMPEVDHANVIVTDNNAYVAARLVDGKELTKDIERKISDQVKAVDRDIDDVYISVNPDFYDRMTNYSNDIRNGQPIEGLYDEFTKTVQRIFPTHINK